MSQPPRHAPGLRSFLPRPLDRSPQHPREHLPRAPPNRSRKVRRQSPPCRKIALLPQAPQPRRALLKTLLPQAPQPRRALLKILLPPALQPLRALLKILLPPALQPRRALRKARPLQRPCRVLPDSLRLALTRLLSRKVVEPPRFALPRAQACLHPATPLRRSASESRGLQLLVAFLPKRRRNSGWRVRPDQLTPGPYRAD